MIITIFLLSLIGGLILLDKMAIGEFGISQPIVSCPLIGLIFGEFHIGLLIGTVLQLIWVGSLPLGSKEPLDNQGAGVIAVATYILAKKLTIDITQEKIIFTCLLFAGIASIVGQVFSQNLKKLNNSLFNRASKQSSNKSIIITHLVGLFTSFIRGFILTMIFLLLFILLIPLLKLFPNFNFGEILILPLAIGIAGIARLVIFQKRILFSILGVISGVAIWILLKL